MPGTADPDPATDPEPPDLDDYQAQFYERASIAEYDGGEPREVAERTALCEVLHTYDRRGLKDPVIVRQVHEFKRVFPGGSGA